MLRLSMIASLFLAIIRERFVSSSRRPLNSLLFEIALKVNWTEKMDCELAQSPMRSWSPLLLFGYAI